MTRPYTSMFYGVDDACHSLSCLIHCSIESYVDTSIYTMLATMFPNHVFQNELNLKPMMLYVK